MTIEPFLPALSATAGIAAAIWRATAVMSRKIDFAQRDAQEIKADIAEMKPKVDLILQHQVELREGKDRMDRIERRMETLEARRSG